MKAILTKNLAQTERHGARIVVSDSDGHRLVVSRSEVDGGSEQQVHAEAVVRFCIKMQWRGKLHAGAIKGGFAFVFDEGVVVHAWKGGGGLSIP
ncbi:MAG: hypothetical protein A2Y38_16990 [Spirochaetes bacterium GWB1_59_5]|nr:MAG: hypothetical protein A2Y38_16990 [Spirochaetes bacterium GWB1_59_5]